MDALGESHRCKGNTGEGERGGDRISFEQEEVWSRKSVTREDKKLRGKKGYIGTRE